jgi:hypothetical protein
MLRVYISPEVVYFPKIDREACVFEETIFKGLEEQN